MLLNQGRPLNMESRLPKEIRSYDILDQLGIEYIQVDHEPAASVDACRHIRQALGVDVCKNLFLCNRQKTKFYMLMMPGDKTFRTSEASHQAGSSRLSFAGAEYMQEFLDITPGSVSVLGLMNDIHHNVQLLIDEDLLKHESIGCHPCINTASVKLKMKDILEKFLVYIEHKPIMIHLSGNERAVANKT